MIILGWFKPAKPWMTADNLTTMCDECALYDVTYPGAVCVDVVLWPELLEPRKLRKLCWPQTKKVALNLDPVNQDVGYSQGTVCIGLMALTFSSNI